MLLNFFYFFLLLENLGAMAYSRYTGFREITDRDVLELHCTQRMFGNYWAFAVFSGPDLIANLSDGLKIMDPGFLTCDDIGKLLFVIFWKHLKQFFGHFNPLPLLLVSQQMRHPSSRKSF